MIYDDDPGSEEPEGIVTEAFEEPVERETAEWRREDSQLIQYAERELKLAGIGDKDADYDGALESCVLELVEVFARQEHSGYSALSTLQLFNELAQFHPLTPNDHSQYQDVSGLSGYSLLQDTRDSRWFSKDGGKTWYNVDDHRVSWQDQLRYKWERWWRRWTN
jgi:hypothetical protein